jgi:hypothetical protein
MYAPRENPRNETAIGKPSSLRIITIWTRRTEHAHFVANIVVLHEELVTVYDMLIEVPSDSLIQKRRPPMKERPNNTRLKVSSYSGLQTISGIGHRKTRALTW